MRAEPPRIPPAILKTVYDHAAAAQPRECCGVLLGPAGAPVDEVRPCANDQDARHAAAPADCPRDARRAFALPAGDALALALSLDGPRPAQVLYHSHVDAPPDFSAEDARLALLGGAAPAWPLCHLVIEVRGGAARRAVLHGWDPATGRFRALCAFTETGAPAPAAL